MVFNLVVSDHECYIDNVSEQKRTKESREVMKIVLKRERLQKIMDMVKSFNIVSVAELADKIGCSEMTIRRDLDELDASGKVVRIHGGAQSISSQQAAEMTHTQKREIHISEKQEIASYAANLIRNDETIYVGPGTTLEFMVSKLTQDRLRIVTNSLPVFEAARENLHHYELILIGGLYRRRSGAFVGSLANLSLEKMKYDRAFVGVNGIFNAGMMTSNMEEGRTQGIGLNRALKKYAVADLFKINRSDFYEFYNLYDLDALITNKKLDAEVSRHYRQFTQLLQGN